MKNQYIDNVEKHTEVVKEEAVALLRYINDVSPRIGHADYHSRMRQMRANAEMVVFYLNDIKRLCEKDLHVLPHEKIDT
jgi:hypothetical protein